MFLAAWTNLGWRLGPSDPFMVIGYSVLAGLAWQAARQEAAAGLDPVLWRLLAITCLALAINKQFDFQNMLTLVGRRLARDEGWYSQRRVVQVSLLLTIVMAGAGVYRWARRRTGENWPRYKLPFLGLVFLVALAAFRAASFHYLDVVLRAQFGGFRLHASIEFITLGWLLFATSNAIRYQPETQRRRQQ